MEEKALEQFQVWGRALDGTLSFQMIIASGPVLLILSNIKMLAGGGMLLKAMVTGVVIIALIEIVYLGLLIFIVRDLMAYTTIPEALELATVQEKFDRLRTFGRALFEFDVGIRVYRMLLPVITYTATGAAFLMLFWERSHA